MRKKEFKYSGENFLIIEKESKGKIQAIKINGPRKTIIQVNALLGDRCKQLLIHRLIKGKGLKKCIYRGQILYFLNLKEQGIIDVRGAL